MKRVALIFTLLLSIPAIAQNTGFERETLSSAGTCWIHRTGGGPESASAAVYFTFDSEGIRRCRIDVKQMPSFPNGHNYTPSTPLTEGEFTADVTWAYSGDGSEVVLINSWGALKIIPILDAQLNANNHPDTFTYRSTVTVTKSAEGRFQVLIEPLH